MWIGPGRQIFVVRASGEFSQEYELAVRTILYLKGRAGRDPSPAAAESAPARTGTSGVIAALSPVATANAGGASPEAAGVSS